MRKAIRRSLEVSVRMHLYPHCGFVADRDVNAAINILQARTGPARSTA
jgi:transposase